MVLTPSALERVDEPGDWLRREVELALECRRNVVPLMVDRFDFEDPAQAKRLTGRLATLRRYQGVNIYPDFFKAAMERLRGNCLNVALETVLHPVSAVAIESAREQQRAADSASPVEKQALTAGVWFEQGYSAADLDEQLRCYSEAIRLKPDYAEAHNNRGTARVKKDDYDGAIQDFSEAIRLEPRLAEAHYNRGSAHNRKDEYDDALNDLSEAIRLRPDYAAAY